MKLLALIFDIFFVLVLCFVVLLVTMIFTKHDHGAVLGRYVIDPKMLVAVVVSITLYLFFMIRTSKRELAEIFERAAAKKSEGSAK